MALKSLHHVAFTLPDIDKSHKFAEDFGLRTVEKSADHLVMQTGGGDAWCYRVERGERGFIGLGFLVENESDLDDAVKNHGASPIRKLDTPGGGLGVTLTSPEGMKVDLVHGIKGDTLVRTQGSDKLCLGTDYPFEMVEPDPVKFHENLDDADKAKILGLNAAKLLGIQSPTCC